MPEKRPGTATALRLASSIFQDAGTSDLDSSGNGHDGLSGIFGHSGKPGPSGRVWSVVVDRL